MNAVRTSERDLRARLTESLRLRGVGDARLAFVLGSGLGAFADGLEDAESISYADLHGMPMSGVPGHAGRLVVGRIAGVPVVAQQGRVHLYEGWSAFEVTRAVRAFGATKVLLWKLILDGRSIFVDRVRTDHEYAMTHNLVLARPILGRC